MKLSHKQHPLIILLVAALLSPSLLAYADTSTKISGISIPEKGIVNGKYVIPINDDAMIRSTATIQDDFAPGCVLVVLNQRTSMEKLARTQYSPRDFLEVNCSEVVDLMPCARTLVQEEVRRRESLAGGSMKLETYSRLPYSPVKRIEKDGQRLYNGGYLFLQKLYHELGLPLASPL